MPHAWQPLARAALFAAVLAGPLFALYVASDRLFQESFVAHVLHWPTYGLYVSAVLSYSVFTTATRPNISWMRCALAVIAAVIALAVGIVLTFGIAFGIGESSQPRLFSVVLAIVAMFTGGVHHFVLRSGTSAFLEIPAHMATLALPLLILGDFNPKSQTMLMAAWPAIFAAIPFAAIVVFRAENLVRPVVLGYALLGSVMPIYLAKAFSDTIASRGTPLAWPMRIAQEFLPPQERKALLSRVAKVHKGKPVRIGEHWYVFDTFFFQNPFPNNVPIPDRIAGLQIDVPTEDVGLPPDYAWQRGRIQLLIGAGENAARVSFFSNHTHIFVAYDDLNIGVLRKKGRQDYPSEDTIKQSLLDYIKARRVPAPTLDQEVPAFEPK